MYDSKAKEKRWRTARALGYVTSPQPADAVRQQMEYLTRLGFSTPAIATTAGVSESTVKQVLAGQATIRLATLPKVQSLTIHAIFRGAPARSRVPSYSAIRRIQALQRIGWTHTAIDELLTPGFRSHNVKAYARIEAAKWRDLNNVYEQLSMRPGPSAAAIRFAQQRGYAPPLAWDDIDDPLAVPNIGEDPRNGHDLCDDSTVDEIAVEAALCGAQLRLTHAEMHKVVVIGTERGIGAETLAQMLSVTSRTVVRHRVAHHHQCDPLVAS